MDKQSLISNSVTVIRIDIYLVGEEPDRHAVGVAPGVSRTTTIGKVLSQNQVSAPGMKSWLPVIPDSAVILGCLIIPPTNRLEAGRDNSTK
jgi:hypothetical protein